MAAPEAGISPAEPSRLSDDWSCDVWGGASGRMGNVGQLTVLAFGGGGDLVTVVLARNVMLFDVCPY